MFLVRAGKEEEIVQATEAAYDAGARTIIAWGYYGSISNDYGAKNPPMVQAARRKPQKPDPVMSLDEMSKTAKKARM